MKTTKQIERRMRRKKKMASRTRVPAGRPEPVAVSFQRNDCIIASLIMHVVTIIMITIVNNKGGDSHYS
jgi:hypothetical protein